MEKIIKVAVTGGIGSGKSTICRIFEKLGIPVFDADKIAKELMNCDPGVKNQLIENFGVDIFDEEGQLIKDKLANIIFNDQEALKKVNNIVHPAVIHNFNEWCLRQKSPYIIQETAILFEAGLDYLFDKIIFVTAPVEVRIDRVMKRDNITREKVMERLKNQKNDKEGNGKSDFIILNDGKEMILPQIITIHNKLI